MTKPILPSSKAPANCQLPGSGCGTVTLTLKAQKVGTSVITMVRNSCGEVVRCNEEEGTFNVKVRVRR